MMKPVISVIFVSLSAFSMTVFAAGKKEKSAGHCEKAKSGGGEEDIEAKDKADCKAKGGKWSKKAKGEHGDHGHGSEGHSDH